MRDTAEPSATIESGTTATSAVKPRPASARGDVYGSAGVKPRVSSETTKLAGAAALAVALGLICGSWITARLAAAASVTRPAPARLRPEAPPAAAQAAPALSVEAETGPGDSQGAELEAVEETPARAAEEFSERQGATPRASAVKAEGRPSAAGVRPTTREAASPTDAAGERVATEGASAARRAVRGQGGAAPCAPYASAGALTLRGGGAAALVVGGPGEQGRVSVTTPDWADIAVLSEGRAGGNGWLRYSVRSVSRRAGVYTVRLSTPCGSQNIRVTVTAP